MNRTTEAVAKAFASIDISDLNERLANIAMQRENAQEAERKAEARCAEIARTIQNWRGVDAAAIADALVGGDAELASRAATDIAELEDERAKLREGIGELRRRVNMTYESENAVKAEARARIGPIAEPLIDEMRAEAEQAAQALLRIWTGATAIARSSAGSKADQLARSLESSIAELTSHPGPLAKQIANAYPVPSEIVALLQPLQEKGPAFRNGTVLQVSSPHNDRSDLIRAMSHRR